MNSRIVFGLVALLVIAVACGGSDDGEDQLTAAEICAATASPDVTVSSPDIIEASGIASSRLDDNILWAHNDSGDTARVVALGIETDAEGRVLARQHATYTLTGAEAIDWEDMAAGPGPEEGASYLYLADIGDNEAVRPEIAVYRVREPEVTKQRDTPSALDIAEVDKFTFRYPDRPHDAETFMVDPMNGSLVIVTKELAGNISKVFLAEPSASTDTVTTLTEIGEVNFAALTLSATPGPDAPTLPRAVPLLPTGGDISPDGRLIAIRTYAGVFVWERTDDSSLEQALASTPCEAPSAVEAQGEAIAFDADGRGYTTISEGSMPPLHHFAVE